MTPIALTIKQAAAACGLSPATINRAIHSQDNPLKAKRTAKVGGKTLIFPKDLEAWVRRMADA